MLVAKSVVVAIAIAVAISESLSGITVFVFAVVIAVCCKGPLDLFQSGGNLAETQGRLEFLEGPRFFNIILRGIDPGTVDMVRIFVSFLLLTVVVLVLVLFLFRALLNPMARDVAQLAFVPLGGNAKFFWLVGNTGGDHSKLFYVVMCHLFTCFGLTHVHTGRFEIKRSYNGFWFSLFGVPLSLSFRVSLSRKRER